MTTVRAYAVLEQGAALQPFEYDLGPLGPEQVDIDVRWCGTCHSDLSMRDNEWGITQYPFVPGHEIVGTIAAVGERVTHLATGETVGLGWYSRSCMTCPQCLAGDHNLCPTAEATIVGRNGGFANRVRAQATWATPIPPGVDPAEAGPLFCGGITVFNPIIQNDVRPTSRVGVVGIGGLGHLALRFLRAWGCEVTAFSTSADKEAEVKALGAHNFVNTRDPAALTRIVGSLDMVLVCAPAALDWDAYIAALRPRGRLHIVAGVAEISAHVFPLIMAQRSIGASPLGSPGTTRTMLEFAARHGIAPVTEHFPMSKVNEALAHLASGRARYRIILDNDLG